MASITKYVKMLMRKGLKTELGTLDEAEIGLATDTKEVFVGANGGNIQLATQTAVGDNSAKIGQLFNSETYIESFPLIIGELDDTGRFYRAIQSMNGKGTLVFSPKEYTIGAKTLTNGESSNILLKGYGTTIKQKIQVYTGLTVQVTINGDNFKMIGITFDGQQNNMPDSTYGTGGWEFRGNNPYLLDVTFKNFNGKGCSLANFSKGEFINCHFDDNAKLGMEIFTVNNVDFTNCTFNRNGYGFKKTRTNYADESHDRLSFGLAIRFRSHHLTFNYCQGNDNGRDGLNVNQGSYMIKFINSECYGNDDGGFTIAADSTSPGKTGDGESPYDIHYMNCRGSNNFTSGIVAYQPVYGLRVVGGEYSNNHRVAGTQEATPSFYNGIFVASGSKDVFIEGALCFDDRQKAKVTALGNPTFTVDSWKVGSKATFPRVAIIDGTNRLLKGYANIISETATSVTLEVSDFNGATLSGIAVGDTITQAVQRYGCRVDNACTGALDVDGFGNMDATIYVGSYDNGQNMKIVNALTDGINLLLNGSFDSDVSVPPTNWTTSLSTGGGTHALEASVAKSIQSYKLTPATTVSESTGTLVSDYVNRIKGSYIKFSGMVRTRGVAELRLFYNHGGTTLSSAAVHPGDDKMHYLEVWVYVREGITSITPRIRAVSGGSGYFDNLEVKVYNPRSYVSEKPQRGLPY